MSVKITYGECATSTGFVIESTAGNGVHAPFTDKLMEGGDLVAVDYDGIATLVHVSHVKSYDLDCPEPTPKWRG